MCFPIATQFEARWAAVGTKGRRWSVGPNFRRAVTTISRSHQLTRAVRYRSRARKQRSDYLTFGMAATPRVAPIVDSTSVFKQDIFKGNVLFCTGGGSGICRGMTEAMVRFASVHRTLTTSLTRPDAPRCRRSDRRSQVRRSPLLISSLCRLPSSLLRAGSIASRKRPRSYQRRRDEHAYRRKRTCDSQKCSRGPSRRRWISLGGSTLSSVVCRLDRTCLTAG